MEKDIEEIYKLYRKGQNLTQNELELLYKHFEKLADLLCPLGEPFEFVYNESVELRNTLNEIQRQRNGYFFS